MVLIRRFLYRVDFKLKLSTLSFLRLYSVAEISTKSADGFSPVSKREERVDEGEIALQGEGDGQVHRHHHECLKHMYKEEKNEIVAVLQYLAHTSNP